MNFEATNTKLDAKVGAFLRVCGRPVDMDAVVNKIKPEGFSEFEIKESVWRLLDQHEAELTPERNIVAVA